MTKKRPRTKKLWRHAGGGCWVAGKTPGPCDDEYRHDKTERRLTMQTTVERHFDMPMRVRGPAELKRLSGVSCIRETKADKPTRVILSPEQKRRIGQPREVLPRRRYKMKADR